MNGFGYLAYCQRIMRKTSKNIARLFESDHYEEDNPGKNNICSSISVLVQFIYFGL
jgi:hypothetical protein